MTFEYTAFMETINFGLLNFNDLAQTSSARLSTNDSITEIHKHDLAIVQKANTAYFQQQYGKTEPIVHKRFRTKDMILCSLYASYSESEATKTANTLDKHQTSLVTIHNGKLYDIESEIIHHVGSSPDYIWVMDEEGSLYISESNIDKHFVQHSYILKENGYGRPVACAGHILVKNGKIVELNNNSGHYQPNFDQLLLCAHVLYKKSVLSKNIEIFAVATHEQISDSTFKQKSSFNDIRTIIPTQIISKYKQIA